jgi:alpha-tubulin suppressor-like RCC1 family protein
LGDGTFDDRDEPVQVVGLADAVYISAGYNHSCAIRTDRTAWCWGSNDTGQLGDGTSADKNTPEQVAFAQPVVWISAGYHLTCAVTSAGRPYCWGEGGNGALGNGNTQDSFWPVEVTHSGEQYVFVDSGDLHSCGTTTTGTVMCWGDDATGQLGNGLPTEDASAPVQTDNPP